MGQGEFALVRQHLEKAIHKEYSGTGDHDVYAMLADAATQQRDAAALRKYAPILEELAVRLDHNLYLAIAYRARGVLHRLAGEYQEAQARLNQAIALFRGLDTRWQLGRTHFELGELAVDQADTTEAHRQYSNALRLFDEMTALPDAAKTRSALVSLENQTQ